MKRSQALKLIANQLDFLNNKFEGMRDNFTVDELSKADVILTTLEHGGMLPPYSGSFQEQNIIDRWGQDTGQTHYARVLVNKWETEDEET